MTANDVYEFDDVLSWQYERSTDPNEPEPILTFLVSWKGFDAVLPVPPEPYLFRTVPSSVVPNLFFIRIQTHNTTIPLDNFMGRTMNVALALTRIIVSNTDITPGTFREFLKTYNTKGFRRKHWNIQYAKYREVAAAMNNTVYPEKFTRDEREVVDFMNYNASL